MDDQAISGESVQNKLAQGLPEKGGKPAKSKRVLDGPTQLYRHFDSDGDLLYVGISLSTIHRLMNHKKEAPWFENIARIEIERFHTRQEALDAEARAIRDEHPIFNRAGSAILQMHKDFEAACAELTEAEWEWLRAN